MTAVVELAVESLGIDDPPINIVIEFDYGGGKKRTERLCHIDYESDEAVLIEVFGRYACEYRMPLQELKLTLRNGGARRVDDPFAYVHLPDFSYSKASIRGRDDRLAAMAPYIGADRSAKFGANSHELLKPIFTRTEGGAHLSKGKTYELKRKYLQRGQVANALLPDHRNAGYTKARRISSPPRRRPGRKYKVTGIPGDVASLVSAIDLQSAGIPMTEPLIAELWPTIRDARETRDDNGRRKQWKDVLDIVCKRHFVSHHEWHGGVKSPIPKARTLCPTLKQIKYIYRQREHPAQSAIADVGEAAFNKNHRGLKGDRRDLASGPGQVVQIDFTICDILLLDITRRYILGRPCMAVIWDTFSSLILGFAITWRRESWSTATLALLHMATDKVEYCRSLGLECPPGSWPHAWFETALGDNGVMISLLRDNLQNSVGCNFDNAAAGRPDLKPIAESGFHWINEEFVYHLPGAILRAKGIRETKEAFKRARKGACLTRPEFEKRFAAYSQYHNHSILKGYRMSDDMMGQFAPSPINLWNYGVAHRTGLPRHEDTNILRMHCLCRGEATVTEEGVMFQGKPYINTEIESAGWLVKGRKKRFSIPILYHPLDLSTIYWIRRPGNEGRIPDLVPLQRIKVEGDFPTISLFELQKSQARQSTAYFHAAEHDNANYARYAAIRDAPAESLIPNGARGNVMTMPHPDGRHQQRTEDFGAHAGTLPHLPASPPRSPGRAQTLEDIFGEDHFTMATFTQNGGM